jgi:hypothetical protein
MAVPMAVFGSGIRRHALAGGFDNRTTGSSKRSAVLSSAGG